MSKKSLKKKLLPVITVIFLGIVGYFLYGALSRIQWYEVGGALEQVSPRMIAVTLFFVAVNYFILSFYDYMGFRYIRGKKLPYSKVLPTSLVCYAFNFNLGALVGGLGFRVRIYSGWGVSKKIIPFVALFSVITTWVGYTFLLSLVCLFGYHWMQGPFEPPAWVAKSAGTLGLAAVACYLYSCLKGKRAQVRGRFFDFPAVKIALAQIACASGQWITASTIVYLFMNHLGLGFSWGEVFFTYLIASIGGVIARIPAGLGVLEAIFLKMHPEAPAEQVLAAILCFRAVYFLLPLILAVPGYLWIEFRQRRSSRKPKARKISPINRQVFD